MYHTSHSSSDIPGGRGRYLGFSVASIPVKIVHGDDRGDISGDDGRYILKYYK